MSRFSSLSSLECESCQLGKHTRVSFPKRLESQTKSPFELVHTDVWGPSRTASTLDFRYFVTFIDDFSRCTWLFLTKSRTELFPVFQKFFTEIRNQFHTFIHILRSDNALKYLSAPIFLPFYPPMGFFISLLVLTLPKKMGWLSVKIVT